MRRQRGSAAARGGATSWLFFLVGRAYGPRVGRRVAWIWLSAAAAAVLLWGGRPGSALAEPLVAITHFVVCRFLVPESGLNPGKVYVGLTPPAGVPLAVRSVTVHGPDGFAFSFNQAPFGPLNLNGFHHIAAGPDVAPEAYYMGFTWRPLPDGLYTVTVEDVAGHVVSQSRTFRDGSAAFIPKIGAIDYSRFASADGWLQAPSSPTISWGIAEDADLYYLLRVWKGLRLVFRDDIFGNGTGLNKSAAAIPSGVLESGAR